MSEVDLQTGEILDTCTEAEARALTEQIKAQVETTFELIESAYRKKAWDKLGYDSWDAYCTAEFTSLRIRIPREERREVISSLRGFGMSTRAIAAATGLDAHTVRRDLATEANAPVGPPATITGVNGKTYAATRSVSERGPRARKVPDPIPTPPIREAPKPQAAVRSNARADEQRVFINNAVDFLRGFVHGFNKFGDLDSAISAEEAKRWKAELRFSLDELKKFANKLEKHTT